MALKMPSNKSPSSASTATYAQQELSITSIGSSIFYYFIRILLISLILIYRWVCIRMDILGALFSSGLAAYLIYGNRQERSSDTGFSLNMAGMNHSTFHYQFPLSNICIPVAFSSMILWWVRILNDFEVSGK